MKTSTKFPRSDGRIAARAQQQRLFHLSMEERSAAAFEVRQQRRLYLCTTRRIPVTTVHSCGAAFKEGKKYYLRGCVDPNMDDSKYLNEETPCLTFCTSPSKSPSLLW